ncbi:hypothetical protein LL3_03997 [Bacillus amyloliquefaciens LL3]|nr:hypothetical protein LL3_03997 [Bacillus amyloliquefaciens LL3]
MGFGTSRRKKKPANFFYLIYIFDKLKIPPAQRFFSMIFRQFLHACFPAFCFSFIFKDILSLGY